MNKISYLLIFLPNLLFSVHKDIDVQKSLIDAITLGAGLRACKAIDDGADVNKLTQSGITPLKLAAFLHVDAWEKAGCPEKYGATSNIRVAGHAMFATLLLRNADPLKKDRYNESVLEYAQRRNVPGLLEELKYFGHLPEK